MATGDLAATRATMSEKKCAVFDGVDDNVDFPHNAAFLGTNLVNGFTICAWINPRSVGETEGRIFDKSAGSTGATGFYFGMHNTAGAVIFRINVGTTRASANSSVAYNVWTHAMVTVSAAQLANFYINGVASGTANADLVQTISTITGTGSQRIGNRTGATDRTFEGGICQVKMWNRVLTAAEIAKVYAGNPVTEGLIFDAPLKEDYLDYSPLGLTGTNTGSYLTNNYANAIVADVHQLNLAATTDFLKITPISGRDSKFKVVAINRST